MSPTCNVAFPKKKSHKQAVLLNPLKPQYSPCMCEDREIKQMKKKRGQRKGEIFFVQ